MSQGAIGVGALRRVAIAVLAPVTWWPPGVDVAAWRIALAEDILDVLATLATVEPAVAVLESDRELVGQVGWPGLRTYRVASLTLPAVLDRAAADGFHQAAVLAGDAPDLPGMIIAKLFRPLTSRPVAVAPARTGGGLLGLAAGLPAPRWLPEAGLDTATPQSVRSRAPQPTDVAAAPGWHRLRTAEDIGRLDEGLEGWDATRVLLA